MPINDSRIKQILSTIPDSPGVYLMKNSEKEIIYIGKAISLKKRVTSYFAKNIPDLKTRMLVKNIDDIEFIITTNEVEALLLENNLIKEHRPRFNIQLKDDKRYPYISIIFSDELPRIIYTRNISDTKSIYFGPYTDSGAARNTMNLVNDIFKLKRCKNKLPLKKGERPCLNFQINKCSGICRNKITKEEYLERINNAVLFLKGETDNILQSLNNQMNEHSKNQEYEKAASVRNIIFDIQKISTSQNISIPEGFNKDFIAVDSYEKEAILIVFEFRNGSLLGRKISILQNIDYSDNAELIQTFMVEYYKKNEAPGQIITMNSIPEKKLIENYLFHINSKKTSIRSAKSSKEKNIINLIIKNIASVATAKQSNDQFNDRIKALERIQKIFNLNYLPSHIVCFDISNIQGTNSVASMSSFIDGNPEKSLYRKFKIRSYQEANDPGMIHEAVSRFLQNVANGEEKAPDLIVIDGGITQLSKAIEARDTLQVNIPIISIAKKHEEIFFDPKKESIRLSKSDNALKIIQNLRDEAHRFGVKYHRSLRKKTTIVSELDKIKGIGEKKRNILLKEMKSVINIKKANISTLSKIEGISQKDAEIIFNFFNKQD